MGWWEDIKQWGREQAAGIAAAHPQTAEWVARNVGDSGDEIDMVRFLYEENPALSSLVANAKAENPLFSQIYTIIHGAAQEQIQTQVDALPTEWVQAAKGADIPVDQLVARMKENGADKIAFAITSSVTEEIPSMYYYGGSVAHDVLSDTIARVWQQPQQNFLDAPGEWLGTMARNIINLFSALIDTSRSDLEACGTEHVLQDTAAKADTIVANMGKKLIAYGMPAEYTADTMLAIYTELKTKADPNFSLTDDEKTALHAKFLAQLPSATASALQAETGGEAPPAHEPAPAETPPAPSLPEPVAALLPIAIAPGIAGAATLAEIHEDSAGDQEETQEPARRRGYGKAGVRTFTPAASATDLTAGGHRGRTRPHPMEVSDDGANNGLGQRIVDFVGGTNEFDYPEVLSADMSAYNLSTAQDAKFRGAVSLSWSIEGIATALKSYVPDLKPEDFHEDKNQNVFVTLKDAQGSDQNLYLNASGISLQDSTRLGAEAVMLLPVVGWAGRAMRGLELGLQGTRALMLVNGARAMTLFAGEMGMDSLARVWGGGEELSAERLGQNIGVALTYPMMTGLSNKFIGSISGKILAGKPLSELERATAAVAGLDLSQFTDDLLSKTSDMLVSQAEAKGVDVPSGVSADLQALRTKAGAGACDTTPHSDHVPTPVCSEPPRGEAVPVEDATLDGIPKPPKTPARPGVAAGSEWSLPTP